MRGRCCGAGANLGTAVDAHAELKPRAIALRVKDIAQLFHTLDPFPFRERDLDATVEEYVFGWAGELPAQDPISIQVHLPQSQAARSEAQHIGDAMRAYFAGRGEVVGWEIRDLFRRGRTSLLIGLVALAVCLLTARWAADQLRPGPFSRFLQEGLIILGWVTNWRPMEIFLYDWWPLVRRRRLYDRLAHADVKLVGEAEPT